MEVAEPLDVHGITLEFMVLTFSPFPQVRSLSRKQAHIVRTTRLY